MLITRARASRATGISPQVLNRLLLDPKVSLKPHYDEQGRTLIDVKELAGFVETLNESRLAGLSLKEFNHLPPDVIISTLYPLCDDSEEII